MTTIQVQIPDATFRDLADFAKQTDREPEVVIREALELYRQQRIRRPAMHSIRDIKTVSIGKILRPWNSRAEMLDDFFDDRD